MSDETPDQVTLDDLPAVDFAQLVSNRDIGVCYRCSCMVMWTDDHREAHERWHAAIEDLSITVKVPVEWTGASAPAQTEQSAGEYQPLREQLIDALSRLNLEHITDAQAIDRQFLPVVEAWCEKYLHRATVAEAELQQARSVQVDIAERAVRAIAALDKRHAELVEALGLDQYTGWQDALDLVRAWRAELDVYRRAAGEPVSPSVAGIIDAQHAALLRLAAKGRRAYAETAPDEQAKHLSHEYRIFDAAARLIEDPRRLAGLIPTSMQNWSLDDDVSEIVAKATGIRVVLLDPQPEHSCEANCSLDHYEEGIEGPWRQAQMDRERQDTEGITDEALSDLLLLVGVTPSAAQLSSWTPEQREQAARWAGAAHLSASDNHNVRVYARPAFLDEYPPDVCPSLYLHNGTLLACRNRPHDYSPHSNGRRGPELIEWSGDQAVPVPWPANLEPPAGIDLLIDTGVPPISRLRRHLVRIGRNAWTWADNPTPPTNHTGALWQIVAEQAQGDLRVLARPAEVEADAPTETGLCPSLRLNSDGVLHACAATDDHHMHRGEVQPDGMMEVWTSNAGVPVPWPLDQEPPAGIDVLEDIRLMSLPGEQFRYLCRVGADRWSWEDECRAFTSDEMDPAHRSTWAEAIHNAGYLRESLELHVVRP